jgi:amino acid adenylation domain-containing protein
MGGAANGADPAVIDGTAVPISYDRLRRLSDRVRDRLKAVGVERGDRVGIYLRKSTDGLAAIFGILKAGAAYVPVDPTAPAERNAFIHCDCDIKAVFVEKRFEHAYSAELAKLGVAPRIIVLDGVGAGRPFEAALDAADALSLAARVPSVESAADDLAYILYTSGSTGRPKGVMLSHRNATAFVDWCSETFSPQPTDVFSSHAPFHFDLSVFDIYLSLKHGATLVVIPEETGKDPLALSKLIEQHRLTVWYSAPSTLTLLAEYGKIAEHDLSSLRLVFFAGEVFPIVHLRSLKRQLPQPRYFNLYGPTETNVCTYFEIPRVVADDRTDPFPIGKTCENLRSRVVDSEGQPVTGDAEGELCIAGPNVMQGYWNLPEKTARAFLPDDGTG